MRTYSYSKSVKSSISLILATSAIIVGPLLGVFTPVAYAASLTSITDTMSKQGVSDTADHTVKWTNAVSNTAGDTITVDFVQADIVSTGTWQTTDFTITDQNHAAVAPAADCTVTTDYTVTATNATSTFLITLCSAYVTSTGPTTFVIKGATGGTGTLTNKATDVDSSLFTITYTGASTDSGTGALVVELNADVLVSASVSQILTFSVDDNSIGFGPLSLASLRYATTDALGSNSDSVGNVLTASTNATGGYNITILGALLTSGANNINSIGATLTTPAAPGATEQFGVRYVATGAGTATVDANYDSATQYAYDGVSAPDVIASSAGPTASNTFSAHYVANMDTSTAAGIYATTLYYVATGSF